MSNVPENSLSSQQKREALEKRILNFAVRVIRLVRKLPNDRVSDVIARQLLKSATSIGANYAEASRASSRKHFISILEIAQREAGETVYWLNLIAEARLMRINLLAPLIQESEEILAILTAATRTSKHGKQTQSKKHE